MKERIPVINTLKNVIMKTMTEATGNYTDRDVVEEYAYTIAKGIRKYLLKRRKNENNNK